MRTQALSYLRMSLDNPFADFRQGQWESIEALLRGERQLVVQRTGWGKSVVYFLGTRLLRDQGRGPSLLISPLLSLMRNQIEAAQRIGVRAATINSANSEKWEEIEADLVSGKIDLLLISPERLSNTLFQERILTQILNCVGLFIVDEAHCISDWGHDFRPDYKRITQVLRFLPPNIPVLATTATANNRVVEDVRKQLGNVSVTRGPLVRESLSLQNIQMPNPAARLAWLAENLDRLPGSGIIYTLTVRDAEQVTRWLQSKCFPVACYHSQLEDETGSLREQLEQKLLRNEVKALVATVALGMGFDKPDIGFVIHYQRPSSVVHYYQQVGRAGRAVDHAYGILFGGEEDDAIADYFIREAFPPQAHVSQIMAELNKPEYVEKGLSIYELLNSLNLSKKHLDRALRLLSSEESPAPIQKLQGKYLATRADYTMDQTASDALVSLRKLEQLQMCEYMTSGTCLMQFLEHALDDPTQCPCGKCAVCRGKPLFPETCGDALTNEAAVFLRRSFQTIIPRKQWPPSFRFKHHPEFKGKITEALVMQEGRALSLFNDPGWGRLVKSGKYRDGFFTDELIEGCRQMIADWMPQPYPSWLTCVPSKRHPELVPSFTKRLAAALGLPFSPCVLKVGENAPQKEMSNSGQQASNLDGVFLVEPTMLLPGAVFLLDDMTDSKWTFTVVAALLRQSGVETVFPVALALNSPRSD